jgi:hypothetical protein
MAEASPTRMAGRTATADACKASAFPRSVPGEAAGIRRLFALWGGPRKAWKTSSTSLAIAGSLC